DSEEPTPVPNHPGSVIDHDALFAASLKRFGNAVVSASFSWKNLALATPSRQKALAELTTDLELTRSDINKRLAVAGLPPLSEPEYLDALRLAMAQRVAEASQGQRIASGNEPLASADPSVAPTTAPSDADDVAIQKLR